MPSLGKTVKGLWSLLVGLGITGVEFFKPKLTVHYPRREVDNLATYRGHIDLVGLEGEPDKPRCIACGKCAETCPSGCITLERRLIGPPLPEARSALALGLGLVVPGSHQSLPAPEQIARQLVAFHLDYSLCSLCGLCVQTCPVQSLTFSREAYLAGTSRADFVYELLGRLRQRARAAQAPAQERAA